MLYIKKKESVQVWRILFIEVGKMLIDTSITIAYKCSSCGSIRYYSVSMFTLLYGRENRFKCRCRKADLSIMGNKDRYIVKVSCIGCGKDHVYSVGRKEIINKGIIVLSCPETGLQLCFMGRDDLVGNKVDKMEKKLDEFIDMFGYESYFKNTQVMFDLLNKIHDIAEQGNLYCECGNNDIELLLLPESIRLKCRQCMSEDSINAATNKDLREMMQKNSILIATTDSDLNKNRNGRLYRKTNRK